MGKQTLFKSSLLSSSLRNTVKGINQRPSPRILWRIRFRDWTAPDNLIRICLPSLQHDWIKSSSFQSMTVVLYIHPSPSTSQCSSFPTSSLCVYTICDEGLYVAMQDGATLSSWLYLLLSGWCNYYYIAFNPTAATYIVYIWLLTKK